MKQKPRSGNRLINFFAASAMIAMAVFPSRLLALEGTPFPNIEPGSSRRHRVDVKQVPWRILGRLQTELGGRCTAFMVAPSVAMTAAHCLWRVESDHYVRPRSVHFLLGYRRGAYLHAARVVSFIVAPGFDPRRPIATAQADRATLIFDHPLIKRDALLPIGKPQAGMRAAIVGYEQDYPEVARGDTSCRVERVSGRLITHDCAMNHGASGAPFLITQDGRWQLAGITTLGGAGRAGVAVGLE